MTGIHQERWSSFSPVGTCKFPSYGSIRMSLIFCIFLICQVFGWPGGFNDCQRWSGGGSAHVFSNVVRGGIRAVEDFYTPPVV